MVSGRLRAREFVRERLSGGPDVFENRIERKKAFESALSVLGLIERTNTTEPNPDVLREIRLEEFRIKHESLILAQNERWRRA